MRRGLEITARAASGSAFLVVALLAGALSALGTACPPGGEAGDSLREAGPRLGVLRQGLEPSPEYSGEDAGDEFGFSLAHCGAGVVLVGAPGIQNVYELTTAGQPRPQQMVCHVEGRERFGNAVACGASLRVAGTALEAVQPAVVWWSSLEVCQSNSEVQLDGGLEQAVAAAPLRVLALADGGEAALVQVTSALTLGRVVSRLALVTGGAEGSAIALALGTDSQGASFYSVDPFAVSVGDLDGDRVGELVLMAQGYGAVFARAAGALPGSFGAGKAFSVAGSPLLTGQLPDASDAGLVEDDARLAIEHGGAAGTSNEIIVAHRRARKLEFFQYIVESGSVGSSASAVEVPLPAGGARLGGAPLGDVVLGDWDSDGTPELFVGDPSSDVVYRWTKGSSAWECAQRIDACFGAPSACDRASGRPNAGPARFGHALALREGVAASSEPGTLFVAAPHWSARESDGGMSERRGAVFAFTAHSTNAAASGCGFPSSGSDAGSGDAGPGATDAGSSDAGLPGSDGGPPLPADAGADAGLLADGGSEGWHRYRFVASSCSASASKQPWGWALAFAVLWLLAARARRRGTSRLAPARTLAASRRPPSPARRGRRLASR